MNCISIIVRENCYANKNNNKTNINNVLEDSGLLCLIVKCRLDHHWMHMHIVYTNTKCIAYTYIHIHWYTQMRSHMTLYILVHTHNSYLPVIEVHEMHCRMNPNYYQIIILFVVDLCSSLAYFTMTQPLPIASKLPIKTLVARQLPTNIITYIYTYIREIYWLWC